MLMSTKLSWSPAQKYIALQAEKACFNVYNVLYKCNLPVKLGLELFEKMYCPYLNIIFMVVNCLVLVYITRIEMCLLKFIRRLLGVGKNAPAEVLRGECGQHKVYVYCVKKCIKYWLKLIAQEEGTLLKSCYNLLYRKCENGKQNWASGVKRILEMYGFGYVWESQNVLNVNDFMKEFITRLKDCEIQNWSNSINNFSKLHWYSMYKTKFESRRIFVNVFTKENSKTIY